MYVKSSIGNLLQTLNHMVAELAGIVCHQMLCCFEKNSDFRFQTVSNEMELYCREAKKYAEELH